MEEISIDPEMQNVKQDLDGFSFKWVKGEQDGSITDLKDISRDDTTGILWVYFLDGTRINYKILDEFMIRLDQSEVEEMKKRQMFPGTPETQGPIFPSDKTKRRNIQISDDTFENNDILKDESPIRVLLQKQKPNWVDVAFKLKLNLPSKNLYDILKESFEDAEKEIIDFVVDDMDIELIKEALRKNIREIYKKNGTDKKQSTGSQEDLS